MAKQLKTALLDADIIAYQIAATNQVVVDWDGDGDASQYGFDRTLVEDAIDYQIGELINKLKVDEVIVCLTDSVNFRNTVLPSYKMNRKGNLKPLHLSYAKEYMAANYPTYKKPYLEADDVMGILSTHPKLVKGKKVIVSIDKDMKQIPGWLFNPDKDKKPRLVTPEEGYRFHMFQTITGDPVDGYSGCPKAGKVAADKLLDAEPQENWWRAIVQLYESKGLTEDDALVQARVARILQWQDYDYTNNEVILWQPK